MTTAELIESHLGPGWVTRSHDDTALLSLLDRLMEEYDDTPEEALRRVLDVTFDTCETMRPPKDASIPCDWAVRLWDVVRRTCRSR